MGRLPVDSNNISNIFILLRNTQSVTQSISGLMNLLNRFHQEIKLYKRKQEQAILR